MSLQRMREREKGSKKRKNMISSTREAELCRKPYRHESRQKFRNVTLVASETRSSSVTTAAPWQPRGQSANQPCRGQTDRQLMDRLIGEGKRTETDGELERWSDRAMERGLIGGDGHTARGRRDLWYRQKGKRRVRRKKGGKMFCK